MTRLLRIVFFLSSAALATTPAAAQFETPSRQFHDKTTFRLEGRHLDVACESCHLKGVYKGTPTTCFACHWQRRQDDRYRLQLGSQCEQCHRPVGWTATRFDHGAATRMPLAGAHAQLPCQSCHANGNFRAAQTSCISCHKDDYQSAREPNHVAAAFPTTCDTCHRASDATFRQARFDHQSSFPLVGRHATQACAACHKNNVYRGTARDCVGCHRDAYNRTTTPNHAAAGFSTACESCHRPTDSTFSGAGFNHNAVFPLVGQHAVQACVVCHKSNVYRGTARECVGCHRAAYERTTAPAHVPAGFSTNCESCHRATDATFGGAGFNHSAVFPLVGRHAQQACAACHKNNVFHGTPRDCVGCHRSAYERTTAPAHVAAGFSISCIDCHRAADTSWTQGRFNHRFPITSGRHRAPCSTCHPSGTSYQNFTCLTCHEHSRSLMDDEHRGRNGYVYESRACYSCHPTGRE